MTDRPKGTVALVTGGSRGIGLAIVKSLAGQGVVTIFTSRGDSDQGKQVVEDLDTNYQLKTFHHSLDVLDKGSVSKVAEWTKEEFGGIDILINNAGLFGPQLPGLPDLQRAKRIIETNYYGSKRMIEAFLPLLKPGGRIVNVSSMASRLDFLSGSAARWKSKLLDVDEDGIDSFIQEFYDAASRGSGVIKDQGWGTIDLPMIPDYPVDDVSDYCISKMALNAYTRVLAKQHPELVVNAMCPGLCDTDISLKTGQPAELGADTAVWLALECSSSGKFFVNRKEITDLERIPLACGEELGETPEHVFGLLLPLFLKRAKTLGLVS